MEVSCSKARFAALCCDLVSSHLIVFRVFRLQFSYVYGRLVLCKTGETRSVRSSLRETSDLAILAFDALHLFCGFSLVLLYSRVYKYNLDCTRVRAHALLTSTTVQHLCTSFFAIVAYLYFHVTRAKYGVD
jgi:hypothetical protein